MWGTKGQALADAAGKAVRCRPGKAILPGDIAGFHEVEEFRTAGDRSHSTEAASITTPS